MPSTITDRLSAAVDGAAVLRSGGGIVRLTVSSGVDALVVTASPGITQWVLDQVFAMRPTGTNTGPVTVTEGTAGTVSLRKPNGAVLDAGDLAVGIDVMMSFDGTNLRIIGSGF